MSYEGYDQLLCKNGHYWTCDAFDNISYNELGQAVHPVSCPYCQNPNVWSNSVDQTNGGDVGFIDMKQFLVQDREFKTCQTCGCASEIAPAIYRIPSKEESEAASLASLSIQKVEIEDESDEHYTQY
jgi:predicted nucleic-acid-binding Zn-ribbon protein